MFLAPCNHRVIQYSTSIYRMMFWQKSLYIITQIDHVQSLLLASPRVLWAIWVFLWANSCGLIAVFQMVGLLKTLPENIMSKLIMFHLYSACVIKGSLASGNTFLLEKGKAAGKDINCSATTGNWYYHWDLHGLQPLYPWFAISLGPVKLSCHSGGEMQPTCWCTITTPIVAS